jgi:[ribosomal protein S5]-alanine N-acetyltransferase
MTLQPRDPSSDLFEPFPELETPRLLLRATTRDDADSMYRLFLDPRVGQYLGKAPPKSIDEIYQKIDLILEQRRTMTGIWWTIVDRESEASLGGAGIWRWEKEHSRGEIGYQIAPSHWGRGLVPEALRRILRFGFERMRLHSVEAKLHPDNRASMRVLEKLAFVKEAHLVENFYNAELGVFEDTAIYSLLRRVHDQSQT